MNMIENYQYIYDTSPLWMHPPQRLLKDASTICAAAGTVFVPDREAGFRCFYNGDIIGDSNRDFTEADCTGVNGGVWKMYDCQSAKEDYQQVVRTNDAHDKVTWMLMSNCCIPDYDKIFRPLRNGHIRNFIIIKGAMAIISIIASAIFIWMVLRSHDGISTSQHRILLGLCISDIIFSSNYLFFGSMAPKEIGYISWNARGNMVTCQIIGFLGAFGSFLGPWYNASLCILFLAIVKYEHTDQFIRAKLEPFLLGVPPLVISGYCILKFATYGFFPDGHGECSALKYNPLHCNGKDDGFMIEGVFEIPCGRGNNPGWAVHNVPHMFVHYIPLVLMVLPLTMIYITVLKTEKKMSKYGFLSIQRGVNTNIHLPSSSTTEHKMTWRALWCKRLLFWKGSEAKIKSNVKNKRGARKSRLILYKGIGYSSVWLLTWGPVSVLHAIKHFAPKTTSKELIIALLYITFTLCPLQGVYNLLIYMHPKILSAKRSTRTSLSWRQAFVKAFWSKGAPKKKYNRRGGARKPVTNLRTINTELTLSSSNNKVDSSETSSNSKKLSWRNNEGHQAGEEVNHEIQTPRDVTYLSFGRRTKTSRPIHDYGHENHSTDEKTTCLPVQLRTTKDAQKLCIGNDAVNNATQNGNSEDQKYESIVSSRAILTMDEEALDTYFVVTMV